ncbi:MAG: hypothetical protein SFY81_03600, partial [Verrucomicrobiota bacterium]|nr:hypothetical protein [Verrucomicrobiota bacterium]
MAALLQKITRETDPLHNPFDVPRRLAIAAKNRLEAQAPADIVRSQAQLARELMNAGKTEQAIAEFHALEALSTQYPRVFDSRMRLDVKLSLAVAHLRLGEQENCLHGHNAESCIFPIQGGGVHKLPRGSRAAIEILSEVTTRFPSNLQAKWLLNIAYMTLGEYPDKVPPQFRIDPKIFASEADVPKFIDVAPAAG